MKENLKVTHYNDGTEIYTGAYAAYDNNESNADIYGYLYNGYTVQDERGVCPAGWDVPTDGEYTKLINYLGGEWEAGRKLKGGGTVHWHSPN